MAKTAARSSDTPHSLDDTNGAAAESTTQAVPRASGEANSSDAVNQDIAGLSYKEASDELERIIKSLESNQLELEESLESYQRGVALLSDLRRRLTDAEQRVEVLMGEIEPEDEESHDTSLS
jgi:exodeoxyribonuclease VII small subunit